MSDKSLGTLCSRSNLVPYMQNKNYYVYILTNITNQVLYVGVTNNLIRRVFEHKNHLVKGFTAKYQVDKLVYFEETENIESAI